MEYIEEKTEALCRRNGPDVSGKSYLAPKDKVLRIFALQIFLALVCGAALFFTNGGSAREKDAGIKEIVSEAEALYEKIAERF